MLVQDVNFHRLDRILRVQIRQNLCHPTRHLYLYVVLVKAVVSKVTLGEADAGIVYRTDVIAAGADAAGVEIPEDINVLAEYPVAVTKDAPNADGAQAFIDFVLSEQGRKILDSYGFLAP